MRFGILSTIPGPEISFVFCFSVSRQRWSIHGSVSSAIDFARKDKLSFRFSQHGLRSKRILVTFIFYRLLHRFALARCIGKQASFCL